MEWSTANADELRSMIKDHILPRIDQLENEVHLLRHVCWPVCQAFRENGQLSDIPNKSIFLSNLHENDVNKLLKDKGRMTHKLKLGGAMCLDEEKWLLANHTT